MPYIDERTTARINRSFDSARRLPGRRAARILVFAFCLTAPLLSCRSRLDNDLLRLSGVPPELAAQLMRNDPAAFRGYARRVGSKPLETAHARLMTSLPDSLPGFQEMERFLTPHVRTIVTALRDEFQVDYPARAFEAYLRQPLEARIKIASLHHRLFVAADDTRLDLASKAAVYESLIEESRPFVHEINLGDLFAPYSELLSRLNREAELPTTLERGTEYALTYGDTALACQFLGVLGTYYAHAEDEVSMKAAWDRGLQLARSIRSWHEARILSFYSAYYWGKGDPTRAVALLGQAEDRCRELKADEAEIRFLHARLNLFSGLSCWDLVERGLRRADVLIRAGQGKWRDSERTIWTARMLAIRMRLAASRGEDSEAIRVARKVVTLADRRPPGPDRERLYLAASRTLAQCGRAPEARALLARTIAHCEMYAVPELIPEARLQEAEFELGSGDLAAAGAALVRFRGASWSENGAPENWIRRDLLAARLAWQGGDRRGAVDTLASALTRLEKRCEVLGPSPETYLTLGRFEDMRTLFHEIFADQPSVGYRFEMGWSDLRFRRRAAERDTGPASVARTSLSLPEPALADFPAWTLHCVFRWSDRQIIRWTRTGHTVTRQVLPVEPRELRQRLDQVFDRLSGAQGNAEPPDPGTVRELHDLARLLLPAELLDAGDHRTLLVSREGPLARVPFEALSLSATEYRPLLLARDVAYLNSLPQSDGDPVRRSPATPRGARDMTVVLTDPEYGPDLMRRWSALNERLPCSITEAHQFAGAEPHSVLLSGPSASRAGLLDCWESARRIYLATHFVRDPDLSYQELIPLAGGGDPGVIDMHDIQSADLSGCDLVVLSGCETGVRYAAGNAEIPSLGEMFLKAGAGAVVQTGWSIRDAGGAALMHQFNDRYEAGRTNPVRALGDARRELIRQGSPPGIWAAYTILIERPMAGSAHLEGLKGTDAAWNLPR